MFRSALLALCLGAASAFVAPKAPVTRSGALSAFESELGVQKPLGFWDPLGMVENVDQDRFDRLRYVELKHGRIAMLAFLGHVTVSNGVTLPGYLSPSADLLFSDVKPGLAAFSQIPPVGTFQIILFIGWLEAVVMRDITGEGEFPGDFRNGYIDFGWDTFSEEKKLQKRAIELNNGRAAQMGILGLMMHEVVLKGEGSPYIFG